MVKITFTRRFIIAVCLVTIVVMVYLLAFYDPLIASQKGLEKQLTGLEDQKGSIPAKPRMQQKAADLKALNAELKQAIKEHLLSKEPRGSKSALQIAINDLFNQVSREATFTTPLRFCDEPDEIPAVMAATHDREGNHVCFKFQGELKVVYAFLERLKKLPCTPRSWIIESPPQENAFLQAILFNLWMEIEP